MLTTKTRSLFSNLFGISLCLCALAVSSFAGEPPRLRAPQFRVVSLSPFRVAPVTPAPEPVGPDSETAIFKAVFDATNSAIKINATLAGGGPGVTPDSALAILKTAYDSTNGALKVNCVLGCSGGGGSSIGGTVTGGTAGSVLFLGPSSVLAQDNANFFYDGTNHFFGIRTATPAYPLDVAGGAATRAGNFLSSAASGVGVYSVASGSGNAYGVYGTTTGSNPTSPVGVFGQAGSATAATAVGIEGLCSGVNTTCYGAYASATGASATNIGGYFTATGATSNYALVTGAGNVGIGVATPAHPLSVAGDIDSTTGYSIGGTALASTNLSDSSGLERVAHKDAASGYAGLDASTLLKCAEMPALTGHLSNSGCAITFALLSADIPNNAANTTGNAGTATALAATPSQAPTGALVTGIAANGNANSVPASPPATNGFYFWEENVTASAAVAPATLLSTSLPAGTSIGSLDTGTPKFTFGTNLITASQPITAPSFNGNLTGNVTGNVTGSSGSTTGNAGTATALASTPTLCSAGQAPTGILASGNATGCASIGGTPAAPTGSLQYNNSGSFSGVPGTPSLFSQVGTPTTPTITNAGTGGAATWTYVVVGRQSSLSTAGHTPATSAASTTTGNATLSTTNYNIVTVPAQYGSLCFDVYRTVSGGTPATTGKIGSCVGRIFNDTGMAGDTTTAPTTDTTLLVASPSALPGCSIAVGGATGRDAPQCSPKPLDDFFAESALSNQWTCPAASFGTSTFTLSGGAALLTPQDANNADGLRYCYQATPSTPWTVTVRLALIDTGSTAISFRKAGVVVSDGTKLETLAVISNNANPPAYGYGFESWTNTTSNNSTSFTSIVSAPGLGDFSSDMTWFHYARIQDDGTNLIYSISPDNVVWFQIHSELRGSFLTTGPTQVGVFTEATQTTSSIKGRFDFFEETQ